MTLTEDLKTPLRRDAQLRRERLISAAVELFASEGFEVPLEKVADRAGVGRATLYRNFPDRESLAVAVLKVHLDEMAAQVAQWKDRDDAFFLTLKTFASQAIARSGFEKIVPIHRHAPGFSERARKGFEEILAGPLARAKAAKLVRADLDLHDAQLLALMLAAGGLEERDGNIEAGIERALKLVMPSIVAPPSRKA